MRILFCFEQVEYKGGAESYLDGLFRFLEGSCVEIGLYGVEESAVVKNSLSDIDFEMLKKRINFFSPDVLHFNKRIFVNKNQLRFIKSKGLPVVLTVHDHYSVCFPVGVKSWIKYQLKSRCQRADIYLVPSVSYFKKLRKAGVRNIVHVPHSINFSDWSFFSRELEPGREVTLLYVGRIVRDKGVFLLLKAFKEICKYHPVKLVFAGDGSDLQKLKREVCEMPERGRISILGYCEQSFLRELYGRADILVLPSILNELFGLVGIEAQASGLPVVASDCAGIREWCTHKETGMLFKRGSLDGLIKQLRFLIDNEKIYTEISIRGRETVMSKFSSSLIRKSMLDLYASVKSRYEV